MMLRVFALVASIAALACSSKGESRLVKDNLLAAPPETIGFPSQAKLGDGVVYLGCDLDAKVASAGGSIGVTHYYKVESPPGAGWKLFTHVVGTDGELINADASPMRKAHPPSAWKAGQIIRDKQTIEIDGGWGAETMSVRLGLFRAAEPNKGKRISITKGKVDRQGRLVAAEIPVKKRETFYSVHRASGEVTIDGKGDESAWQSAPWSGSFVTAKGGKDPVGSARARLLWDDENLYALVEVTDKEVFSPFTERDDTLWKGDVVELFIDADRNRRGYVELQVNPNNAVFDAFFPKTRAHKHHFEWNSSLTSAVFVGGGGWTAEIAVPHRDVLGMDESMKVRIPPVKGDKWRLNIIRVDKPKRAKSITASSWNPITIRDFHALGRMLTVVFADKDGAAQ